MKLIKRFLGEEQGATAVEYSIMVALIAIVIVAAVQLVGNNLNALFSSFVSEMGWNE